MRYSNFLFFLIFFAISCGRQVNSTNKNTDSTSKNINTDTSVFGVKEHLSKALKGDIYLLAENTPKLPNFDTMHSVGSLFTKTINIPNRSWQEGFPGITDRFEWFAVVYNGTFSPEKSGIYQLGLSSDDGSKLYIDDSLLINNDGLHSESSGTGEINLDNGNHKIRLEYFQGPRYYIALQLFDNLKGEPEELFPGPHLILVEKHNSLWLIIGIVAAVLIIILVIIKTRRPSVQVFSIF